MEETNAIVESINSSTVASCQVQAKAYNNRPTHLLCGLGSLRIAYSGPLRGLTQLSGRSTSSPTAS